MFTTKRIRLFLLITSAVLVLLLLNLFLFRNQILQYGIKKASAQLDDRYQTHLIIGTAEFNGISGIDLKRVLLQPKESGDTIFFVGNVELELQLSSIFKPRALIRALHLDSVSGNINLIKNHLGQKKRSISTDTTLAPKSSLVLLYQKFKKLFHQLPQKVNASSLNFTWTDSVGTVHFQIRQAILANEQWEMLGAWGTINHLKQWRAEGIFDPSEMRGSVALKPLQEEQFTLPWLSERTGLSIGFEELNMQLDKTKVVKQELSIEGSINLKTPTIKHQKLAEQDIAIEQIQVFGKVYLEDNRLTLDSSSKVLLDTMLIRPFVQIKKNPYPSLIVKFNTDTFQAQQLIEVLPKNVFSTMEGMLLGGELAYHFDLRFNSQYPDSVFLEAGFYKNRFSVKKWGKAFLPKLNQDFTYTAYENNRPNRSWVVGIENPDFTPLEQISSYLKAAVLTAEDPSFLRHRGFVPQAIRQSIAINYKEKKFKRGASTISMQLVKNLFLSRKKVLSRKLEEMLFTWVMENSYVVSKERLFEIYLNIIEWGPGVYGIGEASSFYFDKKPQELTLGESIYLASIIPRPKGFKWKFDDKGNLQSYMAGFYRICAKRMVHRELIAPLDTVGLQPQVTLSGPAKTFITKTDTILPDSLLLPSFGPE